MNKDCIDLLMKYINKHFLDDKISNLIDEALRDCFDDLSNLYHTDNIVDNDNNLIDSHHFNLLIID